MFSCEFCEISNNAFLQNTPGRLLLFYETDFSEKITLSGFSGLMVPKKLIPIPFCVFLLIDYKIFYLFYTIVTGRIRLLSTLHNKNFRFREQLTYMHELAPR